LSLLRQAIEEDPASPNLVMNLGLELVRSGDAAAGLVHYREAFHLMAGQAKSEIVPELREVLLTQFTCQLYKVRAYAEVVTTLTSPLARNGGLTASLHYALGLAHHELRDHREAAEQMRQCLAKVSEPTLTPINTDILTTAPHHCLALSLAKLGETAGAEQAFHAGLAKQGRVAELKLDYARFLSEHNRPVDALHQLHEIVAENAANAVVWQLGGQIALGRPEFLEFARDWTAEAIKYLPEDAGILTQRAEALLLSQDIPMARELWKGLWERGREPGSLAALVMCELLDGSVTHLPQNEWEAASTAQAWLSWYRKCLTVGASEMVARVNARLEELRRVLPAAAQVLETVLAEVQPPHVAESCVG
ncbi:MAG TPA: hypothetical protein VNZ22_19575, partial [Bacillota bacterium]|nr:hypothetical protein [Bacillota bacterium]